MNYPHESLGRATRIALASLMRNAVLHPRFVHSITSVEFIQDTRVLPPPLAAATHVSTNNNPGETKPKLTVTDRDPVKVATECLANRKRPCLHFPAHINSPGGAWWKEDNDVETDVCLRSSLLIPLEDRSNYDFKRSWKYPLMPSNMLVVPDVLYFRDPDGYDYPSKEMVWMTTMLSGVRPQPHVRRDGTLRPCDERLIESAYSTVFRVAAEKKFEAVILYGLLGIDDLYRDYPFAHVCNCLKAAFTKHCQVPDVFVCVPHWSEKERSQLANMV